MELEYFTDDPRERRTCDEYWLRDKDGFVYLVKEVAERHGLQSREVYKLVSQWCEAYSPEDVCSRCGARHRPYTSRSEYSGRGSRRSSWVCSDCKRRAAEEAERQQAARKAQVQDFYEGYPKGTVCFQDNGVLTPASLKSVTALVSIMRLAAAEQLTYISPLNQLPEQQYLSPTDEYSAELLQLLTGEGILTPNVSHSPVQAFVFDNKDEFTGRYYIFYVAYDMPLVLSPEFDNPVDDPAYLVETVEKILRNMDWPEPWNAQWLPLWKEVAMHECLQYLDLMMTEHGLDFSPGEKTRQAINSALTTFSVAQVYNFIWGSVKDSAAYYMRSRVPKRRAANSVVGRIQRRADRARAEGWDVKAFRRDWRRPQSMFSRVLFDVVLQIGEDGFNTPPS